MSNRTIVELNHDFAVKLDHERFDFCNALVRALRTGSKDAWEELRGFGVTFVTSGHHTEDIVSAFEKTRR